MEATALFLLLLLPPTDTAGDTAAGIQASLRGELGDVSMVIAPDTLVTPSMWQGDHAQMRARFVVRVAWKDAEHAAIDLLAGASDAAKSYRGGRQLAFAPEDDKAERGRAIGLVIAELLRSSPTSAWADGKQARPLVAPSRLEVGGMFAAERANAGNWAYGPALTYGFGLGEGIELRAAAVATFGSKDQYKDMAVLAGANWDFLRLLDNRYAVGVGLYAGYAYESATFTVSGAGQTISSPSSKSNLVGAGSLRARATLWRSLRLVAEGGLRVMSGGISRPTIVIRHDDDDPADITAPGFRYSRWRPSFSVGIEMAF